MLSSSTKLESKLYDCCSELYQSATYTFEIQRQSGPRWATIITPAFGSFHQFNPLHIKINADFQLLKIIQL